jgi:hypothetical protein
MMPSPVRSKREKAAFISAYITVLMAYVIAIIKNYIIHEQWQWLLRAAWPEGNQS